MEANELIERGDFKAALRVLDREREAGLTARDTGKLEKVIDAARLLDERSEGKHHEAAEWLVYAAEQNILFIGHARARESGRPGPASSTNPPWRSRVRPGLLLAWALLGTILAATLGSRAAAPAVWFEELAVLGVAFGLLFVLVVARRDGSGRPVRVDRVIGALTSGAGLFGLAYSAGILGSDRHVVGADRNPFVSSFWIVFVLACALPMLVAGSLPRLLDRRN